MAHDFRGFRPYLVGSIAFGPGVRQNITLGMCGRAKLFTSWQLRSKKREEEPGS
jgi:hypothetical protein